MGARSPRTSHDGGVRESSPEFDHLTAHDLRAAGSVKWTKYGGDVIGAFVAEMDFGTAPPVVAALQEAVAAGRFGYLPPDLAAALARATAQWQVRRYGWQVAPEQILAVPDVLTAFELTMHHFTPPDSPVILPTPNYMPFTSIPGYYRRRVIEVPMQRDADGVYRLDLAGIDAAFAAGGRLLVLCQPANPVGRVFTASELAAVAELVARHRGRVFADEIHAPLVYPEHRHVPYASVNETAAAHAVTAVSASKAWNLPGLKCAQVILPPDDVDAWQRVGGTGSALPSTLGAVASIAAYREGGRWLAGVLRYLDRNRRELASALATHLPEVGYRPPEGTYLAWLDVRRLGLAEPARFFLEKAGVALVDGADCGAAGRGYLRLNFATPLPILTRIVTRMAHALR